MASNSFGSLFRVTTWGESHGKAIGAIIDGCPAGLPLSEGDIQPYLDRRAPGKNPYTSPRKETDIVEILSGVFEGKTTGTPISLLIWNQDTDSRPYQTVQNLLKPGHAQFSYLEKYGVFDHRGGGRASARETACRVAAGAVAHKILAYFDIFILSYLQEVGNIHLEDFVADTVTSMQEKIQSSVLFCPDPETTLAMQEKITQQQTSGDSIGGIVACQALGLPSGLGDPLYEKLEATLAKGMLSIPACKGIEFGSGFASARLSGSQNNDLFFQTEKGKIQTRTNHAGGLLGGISTGMPLLLRVVFKPPSSIAKPQNTCTPQGEQGLFTLPLSSRHDPCVAIRAVPVVAAMTALCLVDALLLHRCSRLSHPF